MRAMVPPERMTAFGRWLDRAKMSREQVAVDLSVSAATVRNWCIVGRPSPADWMKMRIEMYTDGAVTVLDWFEFPKEKFPTASQLHPTKFRAA